ncbi:MBL fold metallo-hydrolase [Flavitalea sp.]|nr:MBL fold metallo-hydrolase [Flavitalea sp.]
MIKTEKNESTQHHNYFEVAPGVWGMKDIFVNFYMIRDKSSGDWVLIDAGLKTSKSKILKMAAELFGELNPKAIILTHGHFDHTGSVESLAHEWKTPVYAHYLEFPYLSGISAYPPPDPSVGGGLMSVMSKFYRNEPIDISSFLSALAENDEVPFLTEWKYIHTPGHSPGHISLFREEDRVLIAGDAFVTTKPESLISTITQKVKVSGPPMYFTCDWESAKRSVRTLVELTPTVAATGHGKPFSGKEMIEQLQKLADNFGTEALPEKGRYVYEPAIADASGVLYIPPISPVSYNKWMMAAGIILTGLLIMGIVRYARSDDR